MSIGHGPIVRRAMRFWLEGPVRVTALWSASTRVVRWVDGGNR